MEAGNSQIESLAARVWIDKPIAGALGENLVRQVRVNPSAAAWVERNPNKNNKEPTRR
jgi:hypothetical protein